MADNEHNQLTVSVPSETSSTKVSVDAKGAIGQPELSGSALTHNTEDKELEADLEGVVKEDGDEPDAPEAPTTEDTPEEDPKPLEDVGDLPEYDGANDEVKAAYDAKYLTEVDGKPKLNLDAFNEEAQAHLDNGKLDINKGSREYLKDTFGVDDTAIDLYLSGLAQKSAQQFEGIAEVAGGVEAYSAMIDWARTDAGYTQAQRDAFNAELKKGGDAAEAAVALLKSRFERAGGKAPKAAASKSKTETPEKTPAQVGLRGKRPSSPVRKATGQPAASKVEGFTDSEAHRVAMLEAGDDPAKVEAVRARLRASSWFGK